MAFNSTRATELRNKGVDYRYANDMASRDAVTDTAALTAPEQMGVSYTQANVNALRADVEALRATVQALLTALRNAGEIQ